MADKIPVYIGDDFLKEAYNYFIEGVQNWWTTGKKRVALRNLVSFQKEEQQDQEKNFTIK